MIGLFIGLILLDAWLDGSLLATQQPTAVQATILCGLLALIAIPAQLELGKLARQNGALIFTPIALPATILMALTFYLKQYNLFSTHIYTYYILLLLSGVVLLSFLTQGVRFGVQGVLKNCSATVFSVMYLGLLCSFVPAIRIHYGVWAFLMFIFTVKCSDIGAYTAGRLFGKHKMAPSISPGKTWEGLGGAVVFAAVTGFCFSYFCGIIPPMAGLLFGAIFAVLGQMGDLAESMLKRDATVKDSASLIPGFGGVLDVIDSPLATAPAAFVYFWLCCGI